MKKVQMFALMTVACCVAGCDGISSALGTAALSGAFSVLSTIFATLLTEWLPTAS
jgi:hypothetical protein